MLEVAMVTNFISIPSCYPVSVHPVIYVARCWFIILPAAESPELDPRVSVGKNLPAANSPDPDLRVESRVEDLD